MSKHYCHRIQHADSVGFAMTGQIAFVMFGIVCSLEFLMPTATSAASMDGGMVMALLQVKDPLNFFNLLPA